MSNPQSSNPSATNPAAPPAAASPTAGEATPLPRFTVLPPADATAVAGAFCGPDGCHPAAAPIAQPKPSGHA